MLLASNISHLLTDYGYSLCILYARLISVLLLFRFSAGQTKMVSTCCIHLMAFTFQALSFFKKIFPKVLRFSFWEYWVLVLLSWASLDWVFRMPTHTKIERCKDCFIFTSNVDFYEAVFLHFPEATLSCQQFSLWLPFSSSTLQKSSLLERSININSYAAELSYWW